MLPLWVSLHLVSSNWLFCTPPDFYWRKHTYIFGWLYRFITFILHVQLLQLRTLLEFHRLKTRQQDGIGQNTVCWPTQQSEAGAAAGRGNASHASMVQQYQSQLKGWNMGYPIKYRRSDNPKSVCSLMSGYGFKQKRFQLAMECLLTTAASNLLAAYSMPVVWLIKSLNFC